MNIIMYTVYTGCSSSHSRSQPSSVLRTKVKRDESAESARPEPGVGGGDGGSGQQDRQSVSLQSVLV